MENGPDHAVISGAESLSGYAVTSARPAICQNLRTNPGFLPVRVEAYEESAAAYPLLQGERVGGCLLVAAAQADFFTATHCCNSSMPTRTLLLP